MPNRNLNADELTNSNELLADIRKRLTTLAAGDALLLFAYRRKIVKELGYDERGKPGPRGKLKALKWGQQGGKCAHCGDEIPMKYSELDRKNAAVRIPDDADQCSGLMPITHSERCRSVIPGDADHSFRGDPDQLIAIAGTVIAMPRNVFHRAK